VILDHFTARSQVGVPDSVVGVFISSAGLKVAEDCGLDSAYFRKVGVLPGSGPLGDPPGRCTDPECFQDQMV